MGKRIIFTQTETIVAAIAISNKLATLEPYYLRWLNKHRTKILRICGNVCHKYRVLSNGDSINDAYSHAVLQFYIHGKNLEEKDVLYIAWIRRVIDNWAISKINSAELRETINFSVFEDFIYHRLNEQSLLNDTTKADNIEHFNEFHVFPEKERELELLSALQQILSPSELELIMRRYNDEPKNTKSATEKSRYRRKWLQIQQKIRESEIFEGYLSE